MCVIACPVGNVRCMSHALPWASAIIKLIPTSHHNSIMFQPRNETSLSLSCLSLFSGPFQTMCSFWLILSNLMVFWGIWKIIISDIFLSTLILTCKWCQLSSVQMTDQFISSLCSVWNEWTSNIIVHLQWILHRIHLQMNYYV